MASVTIRDVASRAGFSTATVSLALRDDSRISQATKDTIRRVAAELDYRPNPAARQLGGGPAHAVGLLRGRMRDLHHLEIFMATEEALRLNGYVPLVVITVTDDELNVASLKNVVERGVDGLIVQGPLTPRCWKTLQEEATLRRLPVVVQDGLKVTTKVERFLGVDPEYGRLIARHLLDLGHRRIAIICPRAETWRMTGYRRALEEAGLPFDDSLVAWHSPDEALTEQAVWRVMSLRDRPTAIFAYSDRIAGQIMVLLDHAGWRVPEDVSIVGVNDIWYSQILKAPLTTLRLPTTEIGEACARLLFKRMDEPSAPHEEFESRAELIVRDSTAPPPVAPRPETFYEANGMEVGAPTARGYPEESEGK